MRPPSGWLAPLTRLVDRLRVAWWRWRKLPTVRDALRQGTLPAPPVGRLREPGRAPLVDARHEAFGPDLRPTFGEKVAQSLDRFFEPPAIGARGAGVFWELDGELDAQLGEVCEPFKLRRGIERLERGDDENGEFVIPGPAESAIRTFTGLAFTDLQPEPVEPLKLRLERPPPDMTPTIESAQAQLAWLVRAVREHRE